MLFTLVANGFSSKVPNWIRVDWLIWHLLTYHELELLVCAKIHTETCTPMDVQIGCVANWLRVDNSEQVQNLCWFDHTSEDYRCLEDFWGRLILHNCMNSFIRINKWLPHVAVDVQTCEFSKHGTCFLKLWHFDPTSLAPFRCCGPIVAQKLQPVCWQLDLDSLDGSWWVQNCC